MKQLTTQHLLGMCVETPMKGFKIFTTVTVPNGSAEAEETNGK